MTSELAFPDFVELFCHTISAPGKLQNFTWHSTAASITLQWEASQSGKDVFYQITYNKVRSSPMETKET